MVFALVKIASLKMPVRRGVWLFVATVSSLKDGFCKYFSYKKVGHLGQPICFMGGTGQSSRLLKDRSNFARAYSSVTGECG
jgi:hypothetical protein